MCGIIGSFSRNGNPVSKDVVLSMTESLKHRGPDGEGIFINNTFAFGHRRLSIIDIKGGAQPMVNEDGSIVVILNGEIYNYKELREELLSRNHQFYSQSDTEVIVHLYEEYRTEMFSRLNGMFAIAIADLKRNELNLARDRLGKKPLFYYVDQDIVVFASELKAIVLHPSIQRELNYPALYDYLSLNYIPGEETMLKNVKRVPQGSTINFTQNTVTQKTYWDIGQFYDAPICRIEEDDAIEELDDLLSDSVRLRLRSDVPVGIFLSGGVDSSLIAWKARELGADVCGYTASFGEESYSEELYAREVAGLLDMNIKVFEINPDIKNIFNALVYHADEPLADSSGLPVYLLSQSTARNVKVVLGGDGGDEVFAGYLTYQATLLSNKIRKYAPQGLIKLSQNMVKFLPVSDKKVSLEYKMKRFADGLFMPSGYAHFFWNGTWPKWWKDKLLSYDCLSRISEKYDTYEYLSSKYNLNPDNPELKHLQIADICEYLPNDILAKVDRMSMAHGLEVRSPWLDYRIVEWALKLPLDLKLKNNKIGKYLLKRYMIKRFPARLANRPKMGFSIPIHQWIRGPLLPLVEEFLSEKALQEPGIFNVDGVRKMIERHCNKKASYGFEIWGLLVFMVWHKTFLNNGFRTG